MSLDQVVNADEVEQLQSDDEDEVFFQDIDVLQNHGINVTDIKKLKSVGICTVKGIQMTTKRKLLQIKGISEAKVEKIKEAVQKIASSGFYTALEYSEIRKQCFRISTGSQELDKLLGGGLESMSITEAFGVTAQLPGENGYPGGKVMFVDTENTFRPNRLRTIADRFNLDHEAMLGNVVFCRAYTSEQQFELLDHVSAKFHEEAGVFKLLIIDSIMALFRVDFCGRGELSERQQKLAQMLSKLQKISEEYNVAVFITNQMTADPGGRSLSYRNQSIDLQNKSMDWFLYDMDLCHEKVARFQADPKKPVGGHILAHASTTRISLRKGRGELRIAKIYDSPDLPENEATYAITDGGIADAKE